MVSVKLLLDENLSPRVAVELREQRIDAIHVRERGLLGATDPEVLERAYVEDRILATSNVDDFVKLAHARDLHPGIVLVEDGALPRSEQARILLRALEIVSREVEGGRDLVNRVLHVWSDGEHLLEDVPPG